MYQDLQIFCSRSRPIKAKLLSHVTSDCAGTPQHYASSSLLSIQGVSGNNVYAAPQNLDVMWRENIHVMEFPRENLKAIEKLGEGQFGEVIFCLKLAQKTR